ncbi:S-layer homology domain-containing protein [Fuchsiella alkaliacetigena]|uniref:S-layer homology domain-containing protein n=1 Tax=Fuchsiella alkaliacetigena TaxID=957042 RepID=UPI00200B947C|nr:S-layer homology domain-containing protein [Fuchsiella alkaliacetigena]MCK8824288.1 S-layer homology domain-containing protein [Fuchsiella alkaliacetigena]
MKKIALILTLVMLFAATVPSLALAANPFSDVPTGHWAYESIAKLAELGVLVGTEHGEFKGQEKVSRYEMAVVTAKAIGHLEEAGEGLTSEQQAEVEEILADLYDEFETELSVLRTDVDQNKEDIEELRDDVGGPTTWDLLGIGLGIAGIALSL